MMFLFQTLPTTISEEAGGVNFPPQASEGAAIIDDLYMFITWVSIFFTVLIFGVLFLFLWKYRQSRHPKAEVTSSHNTPLELVWSILPGFVLAYMFWVGFKGYMDLRTPPSHAYEIKVTGMKWNWSFEYPKGVISPELHVPVGVPVQLTITSQDVLHSFFVPAFRTKMDAVPGRYTKSWFTATRVGRFAALCTEYCGTKHSEMLAQVEVHTPEDFEKWYEKAAIWWEGMDPADVGREVHGRAGCAQCHTVDGTPSQGPTWKGIWGNPEQTSKGAVTVDENYIRESIIDPNAKIVSGFNAIMPTYSGRLKEPEIEGVIAFIKSLK